MDTSADAVRAYERAVADLREACASLDETLRTITDTAARLREWPRATGDVLIAVLPLDWPDPQRLVAVIAGYGRAKEAAVRAWSALPAPLRESVSAPEQFLNTPEGRVGPARPVPAPEPTLVRSP